MISIQEALTSIALEKYSEAFVASGYSNVNNLFSLSPVEIDKVLADMGMLKGHTFKFKKMIEDAKIGIVPKPQPPQPAAKPLINKPNHDQSASHVKPESVKQQDNLNKDVLDKVGSLKTQCSSILQTRDSLLTSLKQFLEIDLEPYFQALNQLKSMQQTVKEVLQTDIEMTE